VPIYGGAIGGGGVEGNGLALGWAGLDEEMMFTEMREEMRQREETQRVETMMLLPAHRVRATERDYPRLIICCLESDCTTDTMTRGRRETEECLRDLNLLLSLKKGVVWAKWCVCVNVKGRAGGSGWLAVPSVCVG